MNMIIEYYEWCRSINPLWAGLVVWMSAVLSVTLVAIFMFAKVVVRIGEWVLLCIPAFVAYCFYIAVFAQ